SCYFMFISLSTIGLGDVSVARKDLMVLCFIFVIIGLSLVSHVNFCSTTGNRRSVCQSHHEVAQRVPGKFSS
ncbi:hypothetical protein PFISCL1PPCAC_15442, partial [Pristionchus fissidentatus]